MSLIVFLKSLVIGALKPPFLSKESIVWIWSQSVQKQQHRAKYTFILRKRSCFRREINKSRLSQVLIKKESNYSLSYIDLNTMGWKQSTTTKIKRDFPAPSFSAALWNTAPEFKGLQNRMAGGGMGCADRNCSSLISQEKYNPTDVTASILVE